MCKPRTATGCKGWKNFFLEGATASESDFAWILSGVFIILYLPKIMFLKDTCLTHVWLLSQLDERLGGRQKFQKTFSFYLLSFNTHQNEILTPTHSLVLNLFKECLEFGTWLLNYCRGIFSSQTWTVRILPVSGEGDWSEEVYISTLLVCVMLCDKCLDWLHNFKCLHQEWLSRILFSSSSCCCACLFQSTNALWPAFLAKIWQTMGTPAINV